MTTGNRPSPGGPGRLNYLFQSLRGANATSAIAVGEFDAGAAAGDIAKASGRIPTRTDVGRISTTFVLIDSH
jgi:hypothetical protein